MNDILSQELLQMHEDGRICYGCPFDAGGVLDCRGIEKYGRCLLEEAAERLKEVISLDR